MATLTLKQAIEYIEELDFSNIIDRMTDANYSLPRWTYDEAKICERLYKNFLILMRKYPRKILVPTREVDEFWHNHILDTQRYTNDCQRIFGHYGHHTPGDVAPLKKHKKEMQQHFNQTQALYYKEFGEYL
jgi:hypothetical protein